MTPIETGFLAIAAALAVSGKLARFRAYRALLWGAAALTLLSALFPRPGNALGQYLFAEAPAGLHLPLQLIGFAWWVLGAWLVKSTLDLVLTKTIFPDDNQPHARRLFADLASALVYVIAFVGIIETVFKQPIAAVLATSGVLAIVLGLALQNTLADVFSGLAINIEHPFRAGDWITLNTDVEGEVMEINWRATQIKSAANDLIVIPNSLIAKAIVTNHSRLDSPQWVTVDINIDHRSSPRQVIEVLIRAAGGVAGISPHLPPVAYATGVADTLVCYQVSVGIDEFTRLTAVQSDVIGRIVDALVAAKIPVGLQFNDIRVTRGAPRIAPPGCQNA